MNVGDMLKGKQAKIITVRQEDTLETAATLLASNQIGAMPVRDGEGNVVGILSERDIVRGMATSGARAHSMRVGEVMSKNVVSCAPGDACKTVMQTMSARHFRHLPVMQEGELIGMISQGDAVKAQLQSAELEASVLRDVAISRG